MVAIKQVLLCVVIMTVLLGKENIITRLVKAQPLPKPCYNVRPNCTNYINITEFKGLCNISGYNWWLKLSHTDETYKVHFLYERYIKIYPMLSWMACYDLCPLDRCHQWQCHNDSDSNKKLIRVLNITYCFSHIIYQLPQFRCISRSPLFSRNNTTPSYLNCGNSSTNGKYIY